MVQVSGFRKYTMVRKNYETKKAIAQGCMDMALFATNISRIKYVLEVGKVEYRFYDFILSLLITSLVFQVSKQKSN